MLAVVGVPGTRLLHDRLFDGKVEDGTLTGDTGAVHDVELGLLERRADLVLHDLHPGAVAHDLDAVLDRLDTADVETHRRVELQRTAAWRGFGRAEHDTDLLAQLVDEDADRLGLVEVAGELAQRLRHESSLKTDVGVAHLTFNLGAGRERRHRVDHDDVERTGADEHVGNLERLFAGVGLRDQQFIDVDTDGLGIDRIHGVLGIDVGTGAAIALRLGHNMGSEGGLARGFRAVDLGDPASRQATDTERKVEGQSAGGHRLDGHRRLVAHLHDGALAELLLNLAERHVQRLVSIHHRFSSAVCCPAEPGVGCLGGCGVEPTEGV